MFLRNTLYVLFIVSRRNWIDNYLQCLMFHASRDLTIAWTMETVWDGGHPWWPGLQLDAAKQPKVTKLSNSTYQVSWLMSQKLCLSYALSMFNNIYLLWWISNTSLLSKCFKTSVDLINFLLYLLNFTVYIMHHIAQSMLQQVYVLCTGNN